MTQSEMLDQLEADLRAGKASVRRDAVQRAAQVLAQRTCLQACRDRILPILRDLAANDLFVSVRDAAQNVLDNVAHGYNPTWLPQDREHMVGVRCDGDHVSYFDKRTLCDESRPLKRTVERAGDRRQEYVYGNCTTAGCPHEVKIPVDCEAYR